MAWNAQQNPTGVRNPGVRPQPVDPADLTTTIKDARAIQRAQSGHTVPAGRDAVPIAANSIKAEGFGPPAATSAGQ